MAPTITWTLTDESPRLATAVLLPIVTAFLGKVGIEVDVADLSLAGGSLPRMTTAPMTSPGWGPWLGVGRPISSNSPISVPLLARLKPVSPNSTPKGPGCRPIKTTRRAMTPSKALR